MQTDCHEPLSIEFYDDRMTINGKTLAVEPEINDLIAILGRPELTESINDGWGDPSFRTCYWFKQGLAVQTARQVKLKGPGDDLRRRRVHQLWLLIDVKARINFIRSISDGYIKTTTVEQISPFLGRLTIAAIPFNVGMTLDELSFLKPGKRLWHPDSEGRWPGDNDWKSDCIIFASSQIDQISSDAAPHTLHTAHPITFVGFIFERWNQPTETLLAIPLGHKEHIINSAHVRERDGLSFDALLTNTRLIISAAGISSVQEWKIEERPTVVWGGDFIKPLSLWELIFLAAGVAIAAIPATFVFIYWPSIIAYVCFGISACMAFFSWAVTWSIYNLPTRSAKQLTIKAEGVNDTVIRYFPDRYSHYRSVERLADRLSREVSCFLEAGLSKSGSTSSASFHPKTAAPAIPIKPNKSILPDWLLRCWNGFFDGFLEYWGGIVAVQLGTWACALFALFIPIIVGIIKSIIKTH